LRTRRTTLGCTLLALAVATGAVAGCGNSTKKTASTAAPTVLSVVVTESGKTAKYSVPSTVKGGLVRMVLVNHGRAPHSGQLVRLLGRHTPMEALKAIGGNGKIPAWIRAEGGVSEAVPDKPAAATMVLPAGRYFVADVGGNGPTTGPPAYAQFTVTPGKGGSLPSTPATVTAAPAGKDKYQWKLSSGLRPGISDVSFASRGKNTIHLVEAFRLKGSPSKAQIIKALSGNGPPPPFADQTSFTGTSALDSGKSQIAQFALKPGKYVLFCPLKDRDGGKPHFEEGLLTTVTVK